MFRQAGTVAIETAIGMFFFLILVFFWCEVSYMGYVSATLDYAIAEAGRAARTTPSIDYRTVFRQTLRNKSSLWAPVIQMNKLTLKTFYYDSIKDLVTEHCPKGKKTFCRAKTKSKNAAIAIYQIQYPYQPFFATLFSRNALRTTLSREIIAIQEHERSSFGG